MGSLDYQWLFIHYKRIGIHLDSREWRLYPARRLTPRQRKASTVVFSQSSLLCILDFASTSINGGSDDVGHNTGKDEDADGGQVDDHQVGNDSADQDLLAKMRMPMQAKTMRTKTTMPMLAKAMMPILTMMTRTQKKNTKETMMAEMTMTLPKMLTMKTMKTMMKKTLTKMTMQMERMVMQIQYSKKQRIWTKMQRISSHLEV
jgi:hypothetical protein